MTRIRLARRRRPPGYSPEPFQAIPLINVLMSLFPRTRPRPIPYNPDWERDEPMSGLS